MPASRAAGKSHAAFRTISEVSEDLDVPQHVLRFWETKFNQVKPLKRGGGRRYYRPEDVDLLRRIRELLYTDGYTIKGVQKLLREGHGKLEPEVEETAELPLSQPPTAKTKKSELQEIVTELSELRDMLRAAKG
ncbi:MerR family transcriptional regulator [Pelagibius sp. Alg239-R121]|uniref:MerR family transcriptional regulator n=1 Tax=Pelagibius sp. Alg239-R121 TaxID=2993448 RepID=UPI002AC36D6F|nr:MerR family transcriptional regulator [Pelagibius sp. Alg239-R121]